MRTHKKSIIETTTSEIYCDICKTQIKSRYHVCVICQKDICEKCVGHEDDTIGDYSNYYCKTCWQIGEPFRNKINQLNLDIDKLNDEWLNLCKK